MSRVKAHNISVSDGVWQRLEEAATAQARSVSNLIEYSVSNGLWDLGDVPLSIDEVRRAIDAGRET